MNLEETAATAELHYKSPNGKKDGRYAVYLGPITLGSVHRSHGFWYYMIRDQATGRLTEMRGPEDTRKACGDQLRKAFYDGYRQNNDTGEH